MIVLIFTIICTLCYHTSITSAVPFNFKSINCNNNKLMHRTNIATHYYLWDVTVLPYTNSAIITYFQDTKSNGFATIISDELETHYYLWDVTVLPYTNSASISY
eukprot:552843_1